MKSNSIFNILYFYHNRKDICLLLLYERGVTDTNAKYAGYSGKIWNDSEKMITLESYYVDLFSEEEFKEALMMSKEELQSKNRKEIIESIVPMGDNSMYSCK